VDSRYHVHIANIHDWIVEQLPGSVRPYYPRVIRNITVPSRVVRSYANKPDRRFYFINDNFVTELFAPIYEELAYRYVGTDLLAQMLMSVGIPGTAAKVTALTISDSIFAASHNPDPRSGEFKDTLIAGAVFGAMMYFYGLPAAMLAHSFDNAAIRLQEELLS
jgi:hypothetical protein